MTQTATPPFPPTPVRWGLATWAKILIGFTLATTLGVVLLCSGVIYLGLRAPATRALRGSQLPERHVETIRRLELLDEGERITYFYSDGWLNIEDGMYFFTDRKIVVYRKGFEPPATVVPYESVSDIDADFSDSWWLDGTIWIELTDASVVAIPISSERGTDELYYNALIESWRRRQEAASAD